MAFSVGFFILSRMRNTRISITYSFVVVWESSEAVFFTFGEFWGLMDGSLYFVE